TPLRIRSSVPLRAHFPTPLFGILAVNLFHLLHDIRMFLHHVLGHDFDHLIPRPGGQLLVACAAELLAGHGFHGVTSGAPGVARRNMLLPSTWTGSRRNAGCGRAPIPTRSGPHSYTRLESKCG